MSAATIVPDETLELRLKALRLPSFLAHYLVLAERAAGMGASFEVRPGRIAPRELDRAN